MLQKKADRCSLHIGNASADEFRFPPLGVTVMQNTEVAYY